MQASPESLEERMLDMGRRARVASRKLALATSETKQGVLKNIADQLETDADLILEANAQDAQRGHHLSQSLQDRLRLDIPRLAQLIESVRAIAQLEDPVGKVIAAWERPNGLVIRRVRTPLGVIGVIYESRPNVTVDAAVLCLLAGNASILRSGSDAHLTASALASSMRQALQTSTLDSDSVQLVETTDRDAVKFLLQGLQGQLDVLVPRGGRGLVQRVQAEARVPVFSHLEGICHVYVHADANLEMATRIVVNSKMRRPGICGAAETLLIHRSWPTENTRRLLRDLLDAGCELRGYREIVELEPACRPATEADWATEYLAPILSIRLVDDLDDAIEHIQRYGSQHTESIVTNDEAVASEFMSRLDSAILLHNASTQFADGGEFGMGAEIGIATGKMHARGPVGVEQLTSFQYQVSGQGQVRPS